MTKFIDTDVPASSHLYRESKNSLLEAKVAIESSLLFLDNTKVRRYVGELRERLDGILDFYYEDGGLGE